jgi:predicted adenine nucleotide alpha hydrolase (AANH) superfamily ATPase
MHICCSNCALYPFKQLLSKGFKLEGLWYNPNIHPEDEYLLRLNALRQLQGLWRLDIHYIDRYGLGDYLKAIEGHDGVRCEACYRMRLEETATRAKEEGFDAFSTTLLVSPYQKHELIVETAKEMQEKHGVEFYYEDFRPGYREGVKISRELGLYRQGYCGCIYSKQEREEEKSRARAGASRK